MPTTTPIYLNDSGSHQQMGSADTISNIHLPEMGAASAGAAGSKGAIPAPAAGDQGKCLLGDKSWGTPEGVVLATDYDTENTILIANTANTPTSMAVSPSTLIGRAATGGIASLTALQAKIELALGTSDNVTFNDLTLSSLGVAVSLGAVYPPAHNSIYVNAPYANGNYYPWFATDPTKSLTGGNVGNCWIAPGAQARFHIDVGSGKIIQQVYYENYHNSGGTTTVAAKAFTMWGSNSSASFDDTTYTADTGWTQLTTSISEFEPHAAVNESDPKYFTVSTSIAYRYYAFKISTSGPGGQSALRHIELQDASGPAFVHVETDGKMGINAQTPSHILHVGGVARSTQSTFDVSSDERVKQNVTGHEDALAALLQLRPVRFNFDPDYRSDALDSETGFIAQEVEQIIPDAVRTIYGEKWIKPARGRVYLPATEELPEQELSSNITLSEYHAGNVVGGVYENAAWEEAEAEEMITINDFKVLRTSVLVPMLVKAIQELTARVATLESQ